VADPLNRVGRAPSSRAIVRAISSVPFTRLSRIAALRSGVHRCATGSPARCTTALAPASAAASRVPAAGSHAKSPGCSPPPARTRRRTVWPRERRRFTSAPPINPVAPVTTSVVGGEGV
jgi:hypothetical protein